MEIANVKLTEIVTQHSALKKLARHFVNFRYRAKVTTVAQVSFYL